MAKGYKTGGRVAGTPNRITSLVRENLSNYIIECINSIDFNNLEDSDKVRLALGMLQYVIPKRKAIEDLRDEQPKEVTIQFIDSNGVDISHQYQKEIETMKNSDETDRGLAMDMHNLLRGDESRCIVNEG